MSDADRIVASIRAHFDRGNPWMNKTQLDQHKASNICTECQERVAKAAELRELVSPDGR